MKNQVFGVFVLDEGYAAIREVVQSIVVDKRRPKKSFFIFFLCTSSDVPSLLALGY